MMVRQGEITKPTPFHSFVCANCGKTLGKHFLFKPEKMADVGPGPNGRKPDGKLYCHRDGVGFASSYYQRELRRTLESGIERARRLS